MLVHRVDFKGPHGSVLFVLLKMFLVFRHGLSLSLWCILHRLCDVLCGSVDLEFDTKYTSPDLGPSSFSTGVLGVLSKMFDRSCVHVLVNN